MFIWDFSAIIAVVLIIGLGLVLGMWLFYTLNRASLDGSAQMDEAYFRQCQYCSYVHMDYLKRNPYRCPRCLSYHDLA